MSFHQLLLKIASAALLLSACNGGSPGFKPDSVVAPAPADARFKRVTNTGIQFTNQITETYENWILSNSYLYNGGGVGVIDFNNDGLQDLYFVSTQGACKLYQNKGGMQFDDVSARAGVEAISGEKSGVAIADVNADGWQDIYVCRTGLVANDARRNLLFINNKNGTFTERGVAYGLADKAASNHACFFDADNDGDLDCYVVNYPVDFKSVNSTRLIDRGNGKIERETRPNNPLDSDHLYRNNGNGTFTDISKQAGVQNRAFGLSATAADLNQDGFMDIMVANDYIEPDILYINNPAQPGNFTDRYNEYFRHSSNHTMGVDIADINNDGLQDILALDMLAEDYSRQKLLMTTMIYDRYTTLAKYNYGKQLMRNVLQVSNGMGSYSDMACLAGVFQTDWSWAPLVQDFDNDGFSDIFITNGYRRDVSDLDYLNFTADSVEKKGGLNPGKLKDVQDYLDLIPTTPLQNYCFRNKGDLQFEPVSTSWGFVERTYSNGAVYADLDNDGDMDLIVSNLDHPAYVYQNQTQESKTGGNWIQIKPTGSPANPFAVGARARFVLDDQVYEQTLLPGRGFLSSVEPIFHFGVGKATKIARIEVEFPGKQLLVMENVAVNQRYPADFNSGKPGQLTPLPKKAAKATEIAAPPFQHHDDDIQDFNRERLLPWRLSAPGPALASGDLNGDNLDDVFLGNGPGFSGAIYLQQAGGRFQSVTNPAFAAAAAAEDAGAVFFDGDQDGDLDLLVCSGGNSFPAGDTRYQPHYYTNQGKGVFADATTRSLPLITGSTATAKAFDFDGDGDHDLLLGGWCTPLAWPTPPNSYLLQNNGGVFTDVTDAIAPELRKVGMVRGMDWADLDADGKPELIIAGEWMPIQVYAYQNGRFSPRTGQFGLSNTHGAWRFLQAADIDGDGDIDLLAGNLGLNTRYTATPEAPLRLYAKDFDNNGSTDPLMTFMQQGKEVPVAMRDVLLKQIPPLKKKFVRYGGYAKAGITDLFDAEVLGGALQFQINQLASGVFINQNGKFEFRPFPNLAQVAPGNQLVVVGDKNPDIIIVGNDFGQQVETGPIDAGNGCYLSNKGGGQFSALPARESGLYAPREARNAALLKNGSRGLLFIANNNNLPQCFTLQPTSIQ